MNNNNPLINAPAPQPLSEKDLMVLANKSAYEMLVMYFERSFNILNKSNNPQAVLDEWGTNAVKLFQASQTTVQYIQSINPAYVPPTTTNTYTFNADGTVTLNKPN